MEIKRLMIALLCLILAIGFVVNLVWLVCIAIVSAIDHTDVWIPIVGCVASVAIFVFIMIDWIYKNDY